MGQPITVVEKPSSREGIVRYEINRRLPGLGPARADVLARRLVALGGIAGVHVNANMVTVELVDHGTEGIVDVIADLHLYYVEGVDVPTEEDFATEAE